MLSLFAKHSLFDIFLKARGDIEVDYHHLTEDIGIVLGCALEKALEDKKGIKRFGSSIVPMDDALVLAAVDIGGRPYLDFDLELKRKKIGNFDVELVEEFFNGFVRNCKINLHLKQLSGKNTHHIIEACFKATAKALSSAVERNPEIREVPSTKGKL
jgi:imidazoleglycerol-phosphate dehydratase